MDSITILRVTRKGRRRFLIVVRGGDLKKGQRDGTLQPLCSRQSAMARMWKLLETRRNETESCLGLTRVNLILAVEIHQAPTERTVK